MPRISNIDLYELPEQHILSIRKTVSSVDKLPQAIGDGYGKLAAYLAQKNILMSDVPFVCYHNMDMQNLDVEFAFPVAKLVAGEGEITARTIPSQKAVMSMHLGAYTGMESTYDEMTKWMKEKGIEPSWICYEYYYNDPDSTGFEPLTKVVFAVK